MTGFVWTLYFSKIAIRWRNELDKFYISSQTYLHKCYTDKLNWSKVILDVDMNSNLYDQLQL